MVYQPGFSYHSSNLCYPVSLWIPAGKPLWTSREQPLWTPLTSQPVIAQRWSSKSPTHPLPKAVCTAALTFGMETSFSNLSQRTKAGQDRLSGNGSKILGDIGKTEVWGYGHARFKKVPGSTPQNPIAQSSSAPPSSSPESRFTDYAPVLPAFAFCHGSLCFSLKKELSLPAVFNF